MAKLSHFDEKGRINMVDVGDKKVSARVAIATARVALNPETVGLLREQKNPKGDPLEISRIAGIMGGKKTADLIPLCHQLNLSKLDVQASLEDHGVLITATAKTTAKTGVEMEALTAASVAALTIYDMCKAVDKKIVITDIRLESKTGGKSGDFYREEQV